MRNEDNDDYRSSPAPPGGCGDLIGAVIIMVAVLLFTVVGRL
jgi:hypothetical protein